MKNLTTIKNWQLHHIVIPGDNNKLFLTHFPKVIMPPLIVTGTVIEDKFGRFLPGFHFRSTYIILLDRTNNIIETENSIYLFDPKTENQDVVPDMSNAVLTLFY